MKDARDWDEDYILNELSIGEYDWLEAKGRREIDLTVAGINEHHVRQNLSVSLSAFANTGGGYILLGIKNPQPGSPLEVDDGGVDLYIKKSGTREWLEDIIPNLVDFPLTTFNVYGIQPSKSNSQIAPGRGVFIVQIPDSSYAPHQATDNKYYARVGGKSRPIPHRLVLDIFARRQYPKVNLEFKIESRDYYPSPGPWEPPSLSRTKQPPEKHRHWQLVIRARNVGRIYAQYVNVFVQLPVSVMAAYLFGLKKRPNVQYINGIDYASRQLDNTRRDLIKSSGFNQEYGPSWFDPILPTLSHRWTVDLNSDLDLTALDNDLNIMWAVYADNAPKEIGHVAIRDIEYLHSDDTEGDDDEG